MRISYSILKRLGANCTGLQAVEALWGRRKFKLTARTIERFLRHWRRRHIAAEHIIWLAWQTIYERDVQPIFPSQREYARRHISHTEYAVVLAKMFTDGRKVLPRRMSRGKARALRAEMQD